MTTKLLLALVLTATPLALAAPAAAAPEQGSALSEYCLERSPVTHNGQVVVPAMRYCVPAP